MPQPQGSGACMRFYSNIRAYLDLGFKVEVIQIATEPDGSQPSEDLSPVIWSRAIETPAAPSILGRLMYRLGIPAQPAVEYTFQKHSIIRREVEIRRRRFPEAIYHFEGESMANVVPWLPKKMRSVWSLHDLPSTVSLATNKIACEVENRTPTVPERRELRFMQRVERLMARHTPLIVSIADYDSERLRTEWGSPAEYLPMSITCAGTNRRRDNWLTGGRLRIMHLGRISHLPSYRSLEFLFEKVFPLLPTQVLERISVDVIGKKDESERAKRIFTLAEPYPNITFQGFVEDVFPFYENSDLQIVAATDAAGLRTRIIESFALGLPVLSTTVGARGIAGIKAGEHLLIADTAEQFVEHLSSLMDSPETLERLSLKGLEFYEKNQSRSVVAAALSRCMRQYFRISTV
ncbi:MAG: glycosyltransferase family 4 protein [Acidobacteria bacterium]|nr:glycosyltransferase family 4 protein [Acidobacteriota bacterium]